MRILHVEAGRHLYGGAQQVFYILQALKDSPHEHFLACPPNSDIEREAANVAQVLPCVMKGDLDIGLVSRLVRLIRRHDIELIHVHSRRGADMWGLIAAKRTGIPAVVSRRVDNTEPHWFARRKYHGFRKVITISEGIRQVLIREGVEPEHIQTIRSAVDTQRFEPNKAARQQLNSTFGLTEQHLVLGVIAQLIERKGHAVLLDALPDIIQQHPNVRVVIFGKGPLADELTHRIEQDGLSEHVQMAGFRTDMDQLVPGLDIVVHPAFKEGLGVSLLQASACAVPIVAGNAGGIPEAVRHEINGLLVTPGSVDELKSALLRLLGSNELRHLYGEQGRQLMLDEFSIDVMAKANEALYQTLLK
ncbi:glycosyltransferase family 4 protein [Echinimonas agarilytica]|uniref:Glycosyltransferase family 4 protein n=1 Tax=Echinimonas agarilytica TaxID=1215918 RepID=A0AA41W8B2_9GAMM|nr:glycosyltransferase family 4 protein [Echinimonas agarilytica]MCM2680809.1 glycosyltransferase family 4 protein [Echinimonas agarilytica]